MGIQIYRTIENKDGLMADIMLLHHNLHEYTLQQMFHFVDELLVALPGNMITFL